MCRKSEKASKSVSIYFEKYFFGSIAVDDVADRSRKADMTMELRPVQKDIQACGRVMHEAFTDIAQRHNFPPDFPNAAVAEGLLSDLLNAPAFDAFAGEGEGRILGSIFVSRRSQVGGISVLTIDPKAQNRGVGRGLLQHGMGFLTEQGHTRQQIIQVGYHNRSLCLYAKAGFIASEMLSNRRANRSGQTFHRAGCEGRPRVTQPPATHFVEKCTALIVSMRWRMLSRVGRLPWLRATVGSRVTRRELDLWAMA